MVNPFDAALSLPGCGRVFLDGGSNDGDGVRAFLAGHFFGCAINGPSRLYASSWQHLGRGERRQRMAPLQSPNGWCIRSFESNSALLPPLREQEAEHRRAGHDVRFIDAALSNVSSASQPRTIVTYARNKWGSTATTLPFAEIFPNSKPPALATRVEHGRSFALEELLERAVQLNSSSTIAVRLDVEGGEEWLMESLSRRPELVCALSYLFVEFHHLPGKRANLTRWGLPEELYEIVKGRVHAAMEERPGCKLQVYWRSFWAACGDRQRFEWLSSPQVTDRTAEEELQHQAAKKARRGGRRGLKSGRRKRKE